MPENRPYLPFRYTLPPEVPERMRAPIPPSTTLPAGDRPPSSLRRRRRPPALAC